MLLRLRHSLAAESLTFGGPREGYQRLSAATETGAGGAALFTPPDSLKVLCTMLVQVTRAYAPAARDRGR